MHFLMGASGKDMHDLDPTELLLFCDFIPDCLGATMSLYSSALQPTVSTFLDRSSILMEEMPHGFSKDDATWHSFFA